MGWNLGYNTDLGYTFGYYREQDPTWLDLCALVHGVRPPALAGEKRLRYLELGCGQGVNLCLIADCHPEVDFVGIDFNPAHIAHAQALARAAGLTNVRFVEGNFVELGQTWPQELGQFHYAAAHGILSWIAKPVREGLYRCLDAALLSGGLVYLSYNTLPGWLSTFPVQHLLRLWQKREGLSSLAAIEVGQKRLQALIDAQALMCRVLPAMKGRLDKFPQLDKNYLVQEYLHDVWTCFWFDELDAELAPHKLTFAGTATAGDWYLPATLPAQHKELLSQFTDPIEREVMVDVLSNLSFRRDLWAKGHAPIWREEQRQALGEHRFALLNRPAPKEAGANPYQYATSAGEVQGKPEVYAPLYDALSQGPKTLVELIAVPVASAPSAADAAPAAPTTRTLANTLQAVGLMLHAGHLALLPANAKPSDPKPAKALNRALLAATAQGAPYRHLVAAQLPWVITASDGDQMLAHLHLAHPKDDARALGERFAAKLLALGRGLAKDGQPITEPAAVTARAVELAAQFLEKTLPNWKRLGVV
ncbi:methyltransferase domain-containing protein [Caldichromatium japonicum]|uniref:Methyltransferase domain-containing protein n=1 Tax=Caldichromatium japonicum TaxID=2699430 RepID=A0A6G7VFD8_9GAMM|nr:class I SAM-dependent methyltransferase [Caldichromatium japonicum]QIK38586.1 methyltransferase domain-containing protein [Caldichromatium japonicum]